MALVLVLTLLGSCGRPGVPNKSQSDPCFLYPAQQSSMTDSQESHVQIHKSSGHALPI